MKACILHNSYGLLHELLWLQVSIGQEVLPILHNLEQVSSDEHVGSLAENLLEALKENEEVAAKVCSSVFLVEFVFLNEGGSGA